MIFWYLITRAVKKILKSPFSKIKYLCRMVDFLERF